MSSDDQGGSRRAHPSALPRLAVVGETTSQDAEPTRSFPAEETSRLLNHLPSSMSKQRDALAEKMALVETVLDGQLTLVYLSSVDNNGIVDDRTKIPVVLNAGESANPVHALIKAAGFFPPLPATQSPSQELLGDNTEAFFARTTYEWGPAEQLIVESMKKRDLRGHGMPASAAVFKLRTGGYQVEYHVETEHGIGISIAEDYDRIMTPEPQKEPAAGRSADTTLRLLR